MFERHTTWVQSGCKLCQHNGESGGLFEKEGGLKGRRVTPYMASPSFLTITTQQLGHHSTHHSNAPPQKYSSLQVTLGSTTNVAILHTTSALHTLEWLYMGTTSTMIGQPRDCTGQGYLGCTHHLTHHNIQSLGPSSQLAPNHW